MSVERPVIRPHRGNSFLTSALRLAGWDLDCRAATPGTAAAKKGAAAASSASMSMKIPMRTLLERYSGIPAADVDRHVYQIRDKLWEVYPYACVGRLRFASLDFAADTYYQVALFRLLQAQAEEEEEQRKLSSSSSSTDGSGVVNGTSSDSESWNIRRHSRTRLLDVGCCVGQVLRKLAFDGVDSARLYGTDLDPQLVELGYELFRDHSTFRGGFIVGDILATSDATAPTTTSTPFSATPDHSSSNNSSRTSTSHGDTDENEDQAGIDTSTASKISSSSSRIASTTIQTEEGGEKIDALSALDGKMTLVHATSFFHLFTWSEQIRAASRVVRFLDPQRSDVMIFGRQVGTLAPPLPLPVPRGTRSSSTGGGGDKVFLHNADTWQRLWEEVGERTGTRWRAALEPVDRIDIGVPETALRKMSFCVVRA
ncbi:hypothetical protein F4777DRAFT_373174 [Nemania sp. FL0916]|nr:hypothetical protein F4777DRAFT_373174 [Nemania sp. FL0916]